MKKIISVVGARPNFMKMAPMHKAFNKLNNPGIKFKHLICHTGQHYDEKMSKAFFEDLELPKPDFYLGIGSGSHAEQTARIMMEFEKILLSEKPDLVIVYGDVNSTAACALTAVKLNIKTAHVEAGLRSYDRTMPEEINRLVTDVISDYLFVSEPDGANNLKREGIPQEKIFFTGNTMIDSLVEYSAKTKDNEVLKKLGVVPSKYILMTMHRPSNVDNKEYMQYLVSHLNTLAESIKIVFPLHPRTRKNMQEWGLLSSLPSEIILTEPLPYIEFISIIKNAALVLTDSGGIQEETTYLGIQCLTLRKNTERPVTITEGTNQIVGDDLDKAFEEAKNILAGNIKKGTIPQLWDGAAAGRIVDIINNLPGM